MKAYCVSKKSFVWIYNTQEDKVQVAWGNPKLNPDKNWYPSNDFQILKAPGGANI